MVRPRHKIERFGRGPLHAVGSLPAGPAAEAPAAVGRAWPAPPGTPASGKRRRLAARACCRPANARASSPSLPGCLRTASSRRGSRCTICGPRRSGATRPCWPRCSGRRCRPCSREGQWWLGWWMIRAFPRKGRRSLEAARQYCGQLGERENCQGAESLSVATLRSQPADRVPALSFRGVGSGSGAAAQGGSLGYIEFQTILEIAPGMRWCASEVCRWLWRSPVRATGRTPGFARGLRRRGFTTWWGAGGQCVCSGRVRGRCHRSGGAGAEVCHRLFRRSPARPAVP